MRIDRSAADTRKQRVGRCDVARVRQAVELNRLAGIGQVFIGSGAGHTSRLAHSIEVSEIAAAMADSLNLSPSLAGAIGLAHDCGHPPFSHAGEAIVAEFLPAFNHAAYGANRLAPLGLSPESVDGIRNHSWSRPNPFTPEGEIVRWADRIAYLARDFADSVTLGLTDIRDLPPRVLSELGRTRDEQVVALVDAVISASRRLGVVCMGDGPATALAQFRRFNLLTFYRSEPVVHQAIAAGACLRAVIRDMLADAVPSAGDGLAGVVRPLLDMTDLDVVARSRWGVDVPVVCPVESDVPRPLAG